MIWWLLRMTMSPKGNWVPTEDLLCSTIGPIGEMDLQILVDLEKIRENIGSILSYMVCKIIRFNLKEVFLFGSRHSSDQSQLNIICDLIDNFNPDIVLTEGNFNKGNFNSVEDAIKYGQEMGYVSFFCNKRNISMFSNDPPINKQILFVKNKYSDETGKLYFLLRDCSLWEQDKEKILILMKKILNEDFDESKDYSDYFNPIMSINLFNEITRELNKFRDDYMIEKLKKLLKKYSKIFIIKGDYHLNTNFSKIKKTVYGS